MSDPMTTAAPVHVFTDEQFKQLLQTLTPGPTLPAQVKAVVQTGAEDVLANIKQLLADAEGAFTHVHGAAQQFHADVKANRVMIGLGVLTVFNTIMILHPLLKVFGL